MGKNFKILNERSWADSAVRWSWKRQNFLQQLNSDPLVQPYPAGCTILGDQGIGISALPINVQDNLRTKRFALPSVNISVGNDLPQISAVMATLDLENDTSSYNIVENVGPNGTETTPPIFVRKTIQPGDDPTFLVQYISKVNIPIFIIAAPAEDRYKDMYGHFVNFSTKKKFAVIKNIWGPLSIFQGEDGPILTGGMYSVSAINTSMPVYNN